MKIKITNIVGIISVSLLASCSQGNLSDTSTLVEAPFETNQPLNKPHNFVGWYCPDNLNGFPAVDIANWKNVPVIHGRMPTKEETDNGSSLIFVDPAEYPSAKALSVKMPMLGTFYNANVNRDDLVIVIQAFTLNDDTIVGFRYLNGGNGSAYYSEVKFLSEQEAENIPNSRFVSMDIPINATQDIIWNVLTQPEYAEKLQRTFDEKNQLKSGWREKTNVNYYYASSGEITALFGAKLFGNFYVQNDYTTYTEKFLLMEDSSTKTTTLKISCGPYTTDYENQKMVLSSWAKKVKEFSEN